MMTEKYAEIGKKEKENRDITDQKGILSEDIAEFHEEWSSL